MRILALLLLLTRPYYTVSIADISAGKNSHTHVQLTGKVSYVRSEDDGDIHVRLEDGLGHFVIAECMPAIPCLKPKVGQTVTVKGISRLDGEHKWYEVHPVESMVAVPCCSGFFC